VEADHLARRTSAGGVGGCLGEWFLVVQNEFSNVLDDPAGTLEYPQRAAVFGVVEDLQVAACYRVS
jgi:hypothetical protein